jgi:hypothetical protein
MISIGGHSCHRKQGFFGTKRCEKKEGILKKHIEPIFYFNIKKNYDHYDH